MAKKSIKKSIIENLIKELNECDVDEIILYANDDYVQKKWYICAK